MTEISRTALFGKLNALAYKAIEGATVFCKLRGNPYVELQHWLNQILNNPDSDLHRIIQHYKLDTSVLASDMTAALDRLPRGASSLTDLSSFVCDTVERGWVYGSLMYGDTQVRTGYLVIGALKTSSLRPALMAISRQFDRISLDDLTANFARSSAARPRMAFGPATAAVRGEPGEASGALAPAAMGKQEALKRYAVDLTERARKGELDPIVGRDEEIRQIVDILHAAPPEQPDPDGRGRCGQDRGRRRLRAAHRAWRCAAAAEGCVAAYARCRPAAGRREHEG